MEIRKITTFGYGRIIINFETEERSFFNEVVNELEKTIPFLEYDVSQSEKTILFFTELMANKFIDSVLSKKELESI